MVKKEFIEKFDKQSENEVLLQEKNQFQFRIHKFKKIQINA
jgi:hypothetical protein